MEIDSLADQIEASFAEDLSETQVAEAGRLLMEQLDRVERRCGRHYMTFIAFGVAFMLLAGKATPTLTVFGVALSSSQSASLALALIAAYSIYQAACNAVIGELLRQSVRSYLRVRLPVFDRNDAVGLFEYPTPFRMERIFAWEFHESTMVGAFAVVAFLVFAPTVWLLSAAYWVATSASYGLWLKIGSIGIIGILFVRSGVLMIRYVGLVRTAALARYARRRGDTPLRVSVTERETESAQLEVR